MEKIQKEILQAVTTRTTSSGKIIIVPDLSVTYHLKIGLKQVGKDIGFFDPFIEPTYYGTYSGDVVGIGEALLFDDNYI